MLTQNFWDIITIAFITFKSHLEKDMMSWLFEINSSGRGIAKEIHAHTASKQANILATKKGTSLAGVPL